MRILIIGGAGFLGANLVRRCLAEPGAQVTVLDSLDPHLHATTDHLKAVWDRIRFVRGDIRDETMVADLVQNQDVILNCAAQTSHPLSTQFPLLDADINCMGNLKLLEAVHRGIAVEVTTNGTLLTEENCRRLLDSGLVTIFLSVDGATPETFERIRRGAKFTRVMEGIRRLTAIRGSRKLPGVHFWAVGQVGNIHELPALVRLAKEVGVDSLRLQYDLITWGQEAWRARLEPDSLRAASHQRTIDSLIEDARAVARQIGIGFHVYTENKFSWKDGKLCPWPWSSAFISSEGDVVPCCVVGNPEILTFGNVVKDDLQSIWNGQAYQEFRRAMRRGDIPPVCKGCYLDGEG